MTTDMIASLANLDLGHALSRVLETTSVTHLAVTSLPVAADCHFH
jgi:hypothetical protein